MTSFSIVILILASTPGQGGLELGPVNNKVPLPIYTRPPEPPIVALYVRPVQAAIGRIAVSFIRPGMTYEQVEKILGNPDLSCLSFYQTSCGYRHLHIWVDYRWEWRNNKIKQFGVERANYVMPQSKPQDRR